MKHFNNKKTTGLDGLSMALKLVLEELEQEENKTNKTSLKDVSEAVTHDEDFEILASETHTPVDLKISKEQVEKIKNSFEELRENLIHLDRALQVSTKAWHTVTGSLIRMSYCIRDIEKLNNIKPDK